MFLQIKLVNPADTVDELAQIYGCSTEDFAATAKQLEQVWQAFDENGERVGILGLRPSPAHGSEIVGGVKNHREREQIALALLQTALQQQPKIYAYADEAFWPVVSLQQAGLVPFRAYLHSSGDLPQLETCTPAGFSIVPLSEINDLKQRWRAQEGYSDLIGHSMIFEGAIVSNALGSDDQLGCIALDTAGQAIGVCRVWRNGEEISLTTPAVLPAARGQGLRQAMLAWVCKTAQAKGCQRMVMESWGDSEEDLATDEQLGLVVNTKTPIFHTPS